MTQPKHFLAPAAVAFLSALALAACGGSGEREAAVYLERPGSVARPLQVTPVLAPVTRRMPAAAPLVPALVRALITGPTKAEIDEGFLPQAPLDRRVLSVRVASGTATVNLGGPPLTNLASEAALAFTLTGVRGIERVVLLSEGRPCCLRDMDGRVIEPLTRSLFRGTPFEPCGARAYPGAVRCVGQ